MMKKWLVFDNDGEETATVPLLDGSFMDVCPIYMDEGNLDCFHVPQNSNKK